MLIFRRSHCIHAAYGTVTLKTSEWSNITKTYTVSTKQTHFLGSSGHNVKEHISFSTVYRQIFIVSFMGSDIQI
jgi:hypothetical protein